MSTLLLLPLVAGALWSTSRSRQAGELQLRQEAATVAATSAAYLDQYLRGLDSMASALVHNPSLVVLDEPCSGLDVGATLVVRSLIQRLAAGGRIIIYSSHELEMVERICSEVLILRDGRVAAHATTAALREQVNAASLEDAFRALVFTTDVDAVAGEIVDAITH